jgi:hypothetical protein
VFGENQQRQEIKAIIDTGYTGFLRGCLKSWGGSKKALSV